MKYFYTAAALAALASAAPIVNPAGTTGEEMFTKRPVMDQVPSEEMFTKRQGRNNAWHGESTV